MLGTKASCARGGILSRLSLDQIRRNRAFRSLLSQVLTTEYRSWTYFLPSQLLWP